MNAASADEIIDRTGAIGYTFCTVAYARSFIHIASRDIFKYRKSFAENLKALGTICRQLNYSSSDGTLECLRRRSQHLKGTPTSAMLHYHDLGLRSFGREEVEDRRDRHSWQRRLFVVIPLYLYSLIFTPIEL